MLLAAAAAIGAWAAAWATKRAAEALILFDLVNYYATEEMTEALRTLRAWREQHGDEFADRWELAMATGDPAAAAVDRARRRVTAYFQNADELWQSRLISKSTARVAVDKAGLAVLINVCGRLERRLDPQVNLGFIRRLRTLCPHRRDLMVTIPLQPPE